MDDGTASVGETENWIQLLLQDGPAAAGVTLTGNTRRTLEGHVDPSSSSRNLPLLALLGESNREQLAKQKWGLTASQSSVERIGLELRSKNLKLLVTVFKPRR